MTITVRSASTALVLAALLAAPTAGAQSQVETAELPMLGNWTGVFRNIQQTQETRNGAGVVIGRISGTVDLQPYRESGMDLYQVVILLSTNTPGQDLEWGVSMGRCGSKLIMLEHANQLPGFVTRSGGEGEIRHSVPLNMNAQATYQVGIFRNGHAQQNMIACANLKYDSRMR
ncbi:MAG: hypothetical protein WC700_11215 [Gemmatimonadaceae bacterium]